MILSVKIATAKRMVGREVADRISEEDWREIVARPCPICGVFATIPCLPEPRDPSGTSYYLSTIHEKRRAREGEGRDPG